MSAVHPSIDWNATPRRRVLRRPPGLGSLLLGVVLAGLFLSALRVHVTQLRYARAEALEEERHLLDEAHRLEVEVQGLRHPIRLQGLARSLGFATPERVIELPVREPLR